MSSAAKIPRLRKFLANLAGFITSRHLEQLKYLCDDISPRKLEGIKSPEGLFTAIGELQGSEQQQLEYLKSRFEEANLINLKLQIEEFQQEYRSIQVEEPIQGERSIQVEGPIHTRTVIADLSNNPPEPQWGIGHEETAACEVDSIPHEDVENLKSALRNLEIDSVNHVTNGRVGQSMATENDHTNPDPAQTREYTQNDHTNLEPAPKPEDSRDYAHHDNTRPVQPEQPAATVQKCPAHLSYDAMKQYFHIRDDDCLGRGGFGNVYKGCEKYMGKDVVIKQERLLDNGFGSRVYEQFKREKKLSYIKHPHVMPVYAICEEKGVPRCIMYPLMVNSDLDSALEQDGRRSNNFTLPWEDRVRVALHAARGLNYLHRQHVVHMDIKPGNILLDEMLNARLGDPGMAREMKQGFTHASVSQLCGTDGYIDHFYERSMEFRPVNDIFSFGVVMLRLLTQKSAVFKRTTNPKQLWSILEQKGALKSPEELFLEAREGKWLDSVLGIKFADLTIKCLKEPKDRMDLNHLCQGLQNMLKTMKAELFHRQQGEGEKSCSSCMLDQTSKFLPVKSPGCDSSCSFFCHSCLTQSRNPLECPVHGPAEPPIGQANTYAILICGNDSENPDIFEKDVKGFYDVLNDNRIVGIRNENIFYITPATSGSSQASIIRRTLEEDLKRKLEATTNAMLYFYYSGHSDHEGKLVCSSADVLDWKDVKTLLNELPNLSKTVIILDCCYADNKIALDLLQKNPSMSRSPNDTPAVPPMWELKVCNLERCTDQHMRLGQDGVNGNLPMGTSTSAGVVQKAPLEPRREPPFVLQWSSSTRKQESWAVKGGHSFFTRFMLQGLRSGHGCQDVMHCMHCAKFRHVAAYTGYISASSLEDYIYGHVEETAWGKGLNQNPRFRAVRSRTIPLAYYNQNEVRDEVLFAFEDGQPQVIPITSFPDTLAEFQEIVHAVVKGNLKIASPKHIHILCEDDEIDCRKYSRLKDLLRGGYGVKCRLRTPTYILKGPVTWAIEDMEKYTRLLHSELAQNLGIRKDTENSQPSFSIRLPQECEEEDKNEFMERVEQDLKDHRLVDLFSTLQEAAMDGNLIITLFERTVDFHFIAQ